ADSSIQNVNTFSESSSSGMKAGSDSGHVTSTCSISDVDNLPIMNSKDAENMLTPNSKLSKDALEILQSTPELMDNSQASIAVNDKPETTAKRPVSLDLENLPEGIPASLFVELSSQEPDKIGEMDTGADIIAMSKELESVMSENKELVAAKNKLATQKNDLLKRLEEIANEKEILNEELITMKETKQNLNSRLTESEHELKRTKHEAEKATVALKEASVSAAHRKRFTRVEMARVLMERNQYKERLMELQEAVRWTEMIRASKERNYELQQKRKSSIWKFFSNLFGPSPRRPNPTAVSIRYNSPGETTPPTQRRRNSLSSLNTGSGSALSGGFGSENFDRQRVNDRRERYKQVRAYLNTDLSEGRMQAYGWSLPAKYSTEVAEGGKSLVSVPVPVYCRPLNLNDPGMKIWCAAGVDLSGGVTADGGAAVGASVFYANTTSKDDVDVDMKEARASMTWIGSSTHSCSKVTIIDANYPQNILDCFVVCTSHLLCVTAVPGSRPSDYNVIGSSETSLYTDSQGSQSLLDSSKESVFSSTSMDFSDPLGARQSSRDPLDDHQASDTPTITDVSAADNDRYEPKLDENGVARMSSVLPTMWLGAQSGWYVLYL
ncbi:C-Jun-amino-terminal kinase-interacting protein 4, partial [Exaiptasia diaphana]